MHIGVDGNLLCGKKTGMGTVVYYVLKYWRADSNTIITVFVPEPLEDTYQKLLERNGIVVKVCGNSNYFKWEQIVMPRNVKEERIDVLWCPYNTAPIKVSCSVVVTVHDLIYMTAKLNTAPTLYKKAGIIYRKNIVPMAINNAKRIITISKYARNKICERFPKANNKIDIVYNGADNNATALSVQKKEAFFDRAGVCKPYILGFGSLEARKNTMRLIKAYYRLPHEIRERYQLVLFGFRDYEFSDEYRYVKENRINNIVFLGYVSDEEKTTLYKESTVFVFPSLSEGFGIPILEAYSNRTAVITSNTTSMPEVAGNGAILIDPNSVDEISESIQQLVNDIDIRNSMVKSGLVQLEKFNWEKASMCVMKIIRESVI